jgi:regulatory protein
MPLQSATQWKLKHSDRHQEIDETAPKLAREFALRLLARREHSVLELYHKLVRRGFEATEVTTLLEQLVTEELLSDARYAEVYAHNRVDKGYGPLRIERELRERGVSEEIVSTTLQHLNGVWMDKLTALHRKRFAAVSSDHIAEQARQIRFLRQRGFTLEQIRCLLRSL